LPPLSRTASPSAREAPRGSSSFSRSCARWYCTQACGANNATRRRVSNVESSAVASDGEARARRRSSASKRRSAHHGRANSTAIPATTSPICTAGSGTRAPVETSAIAREARKSFPDSGRLLPDHVLFGTARAFPMGDPNTEFAAALQGSNARVANRAPRPKRLRVAFADGPPPYRWRAHYTTARGQRHSRLLLFRATTRAHGSGSSERSVRLRVRGRSPTHGLARPFRRRRGPDARRRSPLVEAPRGTRGGHVPARRSESVHRRPAATRAPDRGAPLPATRRAPAPGRRRSARVADRDAARHDTRRSTPAGARREPARGALGRRGHFHADDRARPSAVRSRP